MRDHPCVVLDPAPRPEDPHAGDDMSLPTPAHARQSRGGDSTYVRQSVSRAVLSVQVAKPVHHGRQRSD